jgi:hypothetical protein
MLWGNSTADESKPKWLQEISKYKPSDVYATERGWVWLQPNGTEELLVAISGLSLALSTANIDKITFGTGNFVQGGTQAVYVYFNELVAVTGSPTLVVTGTGVTTSITATFASVSKNKVRFNFTIPAETTTLSIGAQSITLAGGSILDAESVAVALPISAGVATTAGTKAVA